MSLPNRFQYHLDCCRFFSAVIWLGWYRRLGESRLAPVAGP